MKCPPFVGVVMAASTGGPGALTKVFNRLPPPTSRATFFVVQHGPAWMLARRLNSETPMTVSLASGRCSCRAGQNLRGTRQSAPVHRTRLTEPSID